MQQHRVALCDSEGEAGDGVRLDERAFDFDDGQRVVVDGETHRGERAAVDETDEVRLVRL